MTGWEATTARKLGIGDLDFSPCRVGHTLHIPCARGHIVDVSVPKGWVIGQKLTCPKHARKKKVEPAAPAKEEPPMADNITPISEATRQAPSPAAGRARRLVYMALEEDYDEVRKAYKPGKSDASIARECGVAEAVVKTIREESYGPLAVPADLDDFRKALDQAEREVVATCAAAKDGIAKLRQRLDLLVKKNGWEG